MRRSRGNRMEVRSFSGEFWLWVINMYKMLNNYFIQFSHQSVRSVKDLFCKFITSLTMDCSPQEDVRTRAHNMLHPVLDIWNEDVCAGSRVTFGLPSFTRSSVTLTVKENDMDQNYANIPLSTCDSTWCIIPKNDNYFHQTLHVLPLTSNCIQKGYGQQTFVSPTSRGWCLRRLRITTAHCCKHIKACAFNRDFLNALQFVVSTACVTRENGEGGSQDHILETGLLHGKGSHLVLERAFLLRQCIRSSTRMCIQHHQTR